ncbi:MAG: T9SS type A sorting domain-containing protein [Chryseobacterium taeanense]
MQNATSPLSKCKQSTVSIGRLCWEEGIGIETLTATVTHCSFTYTVSKTISFGNPVATFDIYTYVPLNASCYEVDAFYIFRPTLVTGTYPSQYQWSYRVSGTSTETIISSTGEDGLFIFPNTDTYDILVRPVNDCGIGATASVKTIEVVFSCYSGFSMAVTPNPASSEINVTIDKESEEVKSLKTNQQVLFQLYELNTKMLIKQWAFDNAINKRQLNISNVKSGNYILVVTKGKFQQSKQIIIRR